ncbi:MAG: restriction endonuclease [Planctomycetes bacterium]|nr:restriction endonuclease [Planctomycetota bacterium]
MAKKRDKSILKVDARSTFIKKVRNLGHERFHQFVRELLKAEGYEVIDAGGRGTDGGKDILISITYDRPAPINEIWVVQCKHTRQDGGSVKPTEIKRIADTCCLHGAEGYLLVTNAIVTSKLATMVSKFNGKQPRVPIKAGFWDDSELFNLVKKHPEEFSDDFPDMFREIAVTRGRLKRKLNALYKKGGIDQKFFVELKIHLDIN